MNRTVPSKIWITGGKVLAMNGRGDYWENGLVVIQGSTIDYAGPQDNRLPPKDAKVIDARNSIVMPGLINGHTHVGMNLFRGFGDDLPFHRWLREAVFPLEREFAKPEIVYLASRLACLEMIRSGTTCFNDMYYHEEATARAVHDSGLRALCGQTVVEISDVQTMIPLRESFDRFLDQISGFPLVTPSVAPHSIYGVERKTLEQIVEYASEKKLHVQIHLSETESEMTDSQEKLGMTPASYLEKLGLWKLRATAAHGVCVTVPDMEILGEHKVGVIYNPESNIKLGNKICPVVELREHGVPVGLGTDGVMSNNDLDLFGEIDFGTKLQILKYGQGRFPAKDAVKILTRDGAEALHLSDQIGSLEAGKQADVILVSLDKPHAVPFARPYSHLVYSSAGADVKTVIVAGRLLMEDSKVIAFDEQELLAECRSVGNKIEKSFQHID